MKVAAFLMAALAAAQTIVVEPKIAAEDGLLQNETPYQVTLVLKNNHAGPAIVTKVVESWRQPGKSYRKTEANRTISTSHEVVSHGHSELVLSRQQSLPARAYDLVYDVFYTVDGQEQSAASVEQAFRLRDPEVSYLNPVFLCSVFFVLSFVGIVTYFVLAILEHPLVFKPTKKERQATPKREESPTATEDWIPQRHLRSRTRAAAQEK